MKVLCVFGTRPEAIKMAPVVKELKKHHDQITPVVCVTAQHRRMLDQVLELFGIEPDYDLDLHFAPTESSRRNLLGEGVSDSTILVTGNTVIDALLDVAARPYDWHSGPLAAVPWNKRLILVTAHRRENFGEPLENICN